MGLYLGNDKVKIHLNNMLCKLNLCSKMPAINGDVLLSIDEYRLKDLNGLLIIAKKDGEKI